MTITILNPDVSGGGICRTIKRQYQQTSAANFLRTGTFGATGIMVEYEEECSSGGNDGEWLATD